MINDIKVAKKRDFSNTQQQIQNQMSVGKGKLSLSKVSLKHLDSNPAFGIRTLSKPSKSKMNSESIQEMDENQE